jgi:hypothetical protein
MSDREITRAAAAEELVRSRGLEPTEAYVGQSVEWTCQCRRCGTMRRVRVRNLRRADSVACRWCEGWAKWGPWAIETRRNYERWRTIADAVEVSRRLALEQLAPLTEIGDELDPVGVLCLRCDETFVTVPERMSDDRPGWFGCERCAADRRAAVRSDAPGVFRDHGLELHTACRGEYALQSCTCSTCGSSRRVSYASLVRGTAPLCWTCTHGIRPDEPHRVYLIRFSKLGVLKVGLTHARHDARVIQHQLEGGQVVEVITVADRATARRLEQWILARYAPWAAKGTVGPSQFPQGGWTETWTESGAPALSLAAALALLPRV